MKFLDKGDSPKGLMEHNVKSLFGFKIQLMAA
jgi:hypothetical protein